MKEILPGPVAHQHMHGAMAPSAGMDLATRRLADHPVMFVHYVE